jgi:hypothetical protein
VEFREPLSDHRAAPEVQRPVVAGAIGVPFMAPIPKGSKATGAYRAAGANMT